MLNDLQNLYKAPRERNNSFYPQTKETKRNIGNDSKLYIYDNNELKYKTMTTDDIIRDNIRYNDMSSSLNPKNNSNINTKQNNRPKSASFIPPKMGISSKSKKIEHQTWIKENTRVNMNQEQLNSSEDNEQEKQLFEVVETLQSKYEQNLQVIEQLYLEKKEMEKRMKKLETQLQTKQSISNSPSRKLNTKNSNLLKTSPAVLQDSNLSNNDSNELQSSTLTSNQNQKQKQKQKSKNQTLTALEAAKIFDDDNDGNDDNDYIYDDNDDDDDDDDDENMNYKSLNRSPSTRSLPTQSQYEPNIGKSGRNNNNYNHNNRNSSNRPSSARGRERNSMTTPSRERSNSVSGSLNLRRSGPSPQLQADTDRYVQKRKFLLEEEQKRKQEEQEEKIKYEQRRQKAILYGKEPVGMFERDEKIRQARLERQQKNHQKQQIELLQTQQQIIYEKVKNERIRQSIDPSKTWEDLKREEEIKRKDRIEKRKQQLAQTSQYPDSFVKSIDKWKSMKSFEEPTLSGTKINGSNLSTTSSPVRRNSSSTNMTPEEVALKLKQKQDRWNQKIEQVKAINRLKHKPLTATQAAIEYERRQNEYNEKRKKKYDEKMLQEKMLKDKMKEEELKNYEKLLQSEVPESSKRLTKAAEDRAKLIREKNEQKRLEELKEQEKQKQKELKLKETAEFLKGLIRKPLKSEEEKQNELKEKIRENKKQFNTNFKNNQKNVQESVRNHPTLIEQYDKVVATNAAGTKALNTFASVVNSSSGSGGIKNKSKNESDNDWKSRALHDDLFDEEEKIQLGLRE